ncbi:unnamed protein product [Didymodactylos carnosus]|uniref:Uncharacterized protein n=1 Tax=Didymodactylos carnosus TaxID=1234261 RepID=A0A8S2QPP2_9BILA|nr:unnamed protein product [Didymodactylos carnosus]CAF4105767.1 unnamed protein product [Didymodactylos carnosus]
MQNPCKKQDYELPVQTVSDTQISVEYSFQDEEQGNELEHSNDEFVPPLENTNQFKTTKETPQTIFEASVVQWLLSMNGRNVNAETMDMCVAGVITIMENAQFLPLARSGAIRKRPKSLSDRGYYIPFEESLRQVIQTPELQKIIMERLNNSTTSTSSVTVRMDITDGIVGKRHVDFYRPNSLKLQNLQEKP